jgi:hypothetical protein
MICQPLPMRFSSFGSVFGTCFPVFSLIKPLCCQSGYAISYSLRIGALYVPPPSTLPVFPFHIQKVFRRWQQWQKIEIPCNLIGETWLKVVVFRIGSGWQHWHFIFSFFRF